MTKKDRNELIITLVIAISIVLTAWIFAFDTIAERNDNYMSCSEYVETVCDDTLDEIDALMEYYDELAIESYEEYGNGRSYEQFYEEFAGELFLMGMLDNTY